jgi:hypothetical protein
MAPARIPGQLYDDKLLNAVYGHMRSYPATGFVPRDLARALRQRGPDGGAQVRIRAQLRRLEAAGDVARRVEPRRDGSYRTCERWYLASVLALELV